MSQKKLFPSVFYQFFGFCLLALLGGPASASNSVLLSWSSNSESNIAGYRVHYGTTSGEHPEIIDTGNTSSTILHGLEEGVIYYCALTAYNVFGLESTKSEEIAIILESGPPASEDYLVVLEPESGVPSGAMSIGVELDEFFQPTTGFVEALDGPGDGQVSLTFTPPAASSYIAWALARAPSVDSDSINLSIGTNAPPLQTYDLIPYDGIHYPEWTWIRIENSPGEAHVFNLTAEEQTLILSKFDPNVLIDRIVLSSDFNFVPDSSSFNGQDLIIISEQPQSQDVPSGAPVSLGVSVISTSPLSYQWIKDGEAIPDATSPYLLLPQAQAEDAGDYCVEIQAESSMAISSTAIVTVNPPGAFDPRVNSFQIIAGGNTPSIRLDVSGESGITVTVQASSDLILWEDLGNAPIDDPITVEDPEAASSSRRFYRVITTTESSP